VVVARYFTLLKGKMPDGID
jgi:hypothetical protein